MFQDPPYLILAHLLGGAPHASHMKDIRAVFRMGAESPMYTCKSMYKRYIYIHMYTY